VHRDLKPENIIFSDTTENAKIKIVDFGFARLKPDPKAFLNSHLIMNDKSKRNLAGNGLLQTPCFTLSYAAPEVLKQALHLSSEQIAAIESKSIQSNNNNNLSTSVCNNSSSKAANINSINNAKEFSTILNAPSIGYDESCDLWSLGVILHTMLCGKVPFSGDDLIDESSSSEEDETNLKVNPKQKRPNLTKCTAMKNKCSNQSKLIVTQEKIIERIRSAASSLTFSEKRWRNVSESAKKLLRGLLNVDSKKRMKLKDLSRHEWIKTVGGSTLVNNSAAQTNKLKLATPKVLNKSYQLKSLEYMAEGNCNVNNISNLNATTSSNTENDLTLNDSNKTDESHSNSTAKTVAFNKVSSRYGNNLVLRNQFNIAFDAFHAAEEKGK
jgi:serine/threonine protein kinase